MTGSEGHEGVNIDVYIQHFIHPFDGVTLHLDPMLTYVPCQRCTSLHKAVGMPKLCRCRDEEGRISEKRNIAHCTNMNPMREVNTQTKPVA